MTAHSFGYLVSNLRYNFYFFIPQNILKVIHMTAGNLYGRFSLKKAVAEFGFSKLQAYSL